jgi:hypothetical protein
MIFSTIKETPSKILFEETKIRYINIKISDNQSLLQLVNSVTLSTNVFKNVTEDTCIVTIFKKCYMVMLLMLDYFVILKKYILN